MCPAVWPFHWLRGLEGALPEDIISGSQFPKVFAWIERFHDAVSAKKAGKAKRVNGSEALKLIEEADFAESEGHVDESDPTGFKKGQEIEVWPLDSGFSRKDRGRLAALNGTEIVIDSKTKRGKHVRIHTPRHGFRVSRVGNSSNL